MENIELTHKMKVLIYVYGTLNDLKEMGFLQGGIYKLSESGLKIYDKLVEERFTPTEEEIVEAMNTIMNAELKESLSLNNLPLN